MTAATVAALAGAADTGAFLATRPGLFREKPQRAASSVAVLGLWVATAKAAAAPRPGGAAMALAGSLTLVNAALLAAHVRAGITTPRIVAGAALSGVVLADVVRRR